MVTCLDTLVFRYLYTLSLLQVFSSTFHNRAPGIYFTACSSGFTSMSFRISELSISFHKKAICGSMPTSLCQEIGMAWWISRRASLVITSTITSSWKLSIIASSIFFVISSYAILLKKITFPLFIYVDTSKNHNDSNIRLSSFISIFLLPQKLIPRRNAMYWIIFLKLDIVYFLSIFDVL